MSNLAPRKTRVDTQFKHSPLSHRDTGARHAQQPTIP